MNSLESLLDTEIRINDFEASVTDLSFREPVYLPFGKITVRPSLWLRIGATVDGRNETVGASEGASLPQPIEMYDDHRDNLQSNALRLCELLGKDTLSLRSAKETLKSAQLGGNFATARMTVETALIDAIARSLGQSVYTLLSVGHVEPPLSISYGKSIAEVDSGKTFTEIEGAIYRGAKRIKLKISPMSFDAVYRAIKKTKAYHKNVDIMVDANGTFDPDDSDHIQKLQALDATGLLMIEEPVSRHGPKRGLDAHRALQHNHSFVTPIAIDDAINTLGDAEAALLESLGMVINLKPGRMGSFIECLRVALLAKELGKQTMVGGMFESTPGRMMTLTLAALTQEMGFFIPGDVSLPQERLKEDLLANQSLSLDEQHNIAFNPISGWGYVI